MIAEKLDKCLDALKKRKWTIAFAEGSSNGKICYEFASPPIADSVLLGGIVALKDHMKEYFFGIESAVLEKFGPESGKIAQLMAQNLCQYLDADIRISVTGTSHSIDPSRNTNDSQSIFICAIFPGGERSKEFQFRGSQEEIADQTVAAISELILNIIESENQITQ